VIETAVFANDDDYMLDWTAGVIRTGWLSLGGFAAKALPIASWKITAETSPARIVRMAVNANCLAVITSSCVEALDPTRGA
jgi:hypothetical protein